MVENADALASGVAENHKYKVVQTDLGHFCGYVKTNFGPQWSYDDLRGYLSELIDIHGGLTYGVDEDGWVGFDCAHAGDQCFIDGERQTNHAISTTKRWEVEDVESECRNLARQVDVLETFAEKFENRGWSQK